MSCHDSGLGDLIARALTEVGITQDRVEAWIGRDCGCQRRKELLNAMGWWAARIMKGKRDKAEEYLRSILGNTDTDMDTDTGTERNTGRNSEQVTDG